MEPSAPVHTVLAVGSTGSGKSSTLNSIAGLANLFAVSSSTESFTDEANIKLTNWFGDQDNPSV